MNIKRTGECPIFLGNAIFGMFPVPRGAPGFPGLPAEVAQYAVLIDGLQRQIALDSYTGVESEAELAAAFGKRACNLG